MNWLAYALCLWVLLGLEVGLKPALQIGPTGIAPSFVLPLVMFVAMHAPVTVALWAAAIAGMLLDLTFPIGIDGGGEVRVPGPMAMGMILATGAALSLRSVLIKRNPLTLVATAVLGAIIAGVVVCLLLTIRDLYGDPITWSFGRELGVRLASSLYTGVVGGLEALILFPMAGLFGFSAGHASGRRFGPR